MKNTSKHLDEKDDFLHKCKEIKDSLSIFLETLPDPVFFKDGQGRWLLANKAGRTLFQLEDNSWQGKTDQQLAEAMPELKPAYIACMHSDENAWKTGEMVIEHETVCNSQGDSQIFEVRKLPIFDENNNRKALIAIGRDITELQQADEQIKTLLQAIEQSPVSVVMTDTQGNIEYVNAEFEQVSGYSIQEVLGKNPRILKSELTPAYLYEELWEAISQGKSWDGELINRSKDGNLFYEHGYFSPVMDNNGSIKHYLAIKKNITEQKKAEEKIKYQENYDILTDLPNKNLCIDRLGQAIKRTHRIKKQLAVIFIDIDHFKGLNDTISHLAGDAFLKTVAQRIQNYVRETDTVARFGGDKFVVIAEGINNLHSVNMLVTDIQNKIALPYSSDSHPTLNMSASVGISMYPQDGDDPMLLLRNAEIAMYKAKGMGRSQYSYYQEGMSSEAFEFVLLENNLRNGLKNNEFCVYYQPQVCIENNQIVGLEALVRWQHPELGIVSPEQFIPVAEETGLIVQLGVEVFRTVAKDAVQLVSNHNLRPPFRIAVNLSIKQLQQLDLYNVLQQILKSEGCKPEWIELEITEGYIMQDPDLAITTLKKFQELGITVSIDDFGTGYSSLAYLKRLPVNKLKIDKSFIHEIATDDNDRTIVEAIVYLARAMELDIIAEGVETREQINYLKVLNCQKVQGYFYSKPLPYEQLESFLKKDLNK